MSATADHAEERTNPAARLGFEPGQVVQEIGYDEDVELELREGIEATTGQELVDEEYDDVADVVLLWFRDEDSEPHGRAGGCHRSDRGRRHGLADDAEDRP
ncbi:hypothetical protein SCALM49S_02820 [Streptomyces californicus]